MNTEITEAIEAIIKDHTCSIRAMLVPPFPNDNDELFLMHGYEWNPLEEEENLYTAMDGHGHVIAYLLEGDDGTIAAAEYATEPGRRVKAEPWEHTEVRLRRASRFTRHRHQLEIQNEKLKERLLWSGQDAIYA